MNASQQLKTKETFHFLDYKRYQKILQKKKAEIIRKTILNYFERRKYKTYKDFFESIKRKSKKTLPIPSNLVRPNCFGRATLRIRDNKLRSPYHYRASLIFRGNIYITHTKLEGKNFIFFSFFF